MKKYLVSTLTAAAAMAVPAFADATLLGSWDFTSMEEGTSGSIESTTGNLTLSTGDSVNDSGQLAITGGSGSNTHTTIDLTSQNISVTEGISIVMTIEGWNFTGGNSNHYILGSIAATSRDDGNYAEMGMTNSIGSGDGEGTLWGGAFGTDSNMSITADQSLTFTEGQATTIIITFIGNTVSLYQDGELVGTGTITSSSYSADATIQGAAIGSWDSTATGNEPYLNISSLEIWKGDVTTLPEPSMFGLMFGLGAIGLVATRRRRRA